MLVDRFGRPLKGLRISVTNRCNHRCIFCHMEGSPPPETELSAEMIEIIARAASQLGVEEYKITGGEPLIRKDIIDIVGALTRYSNQVSMTTNGSLLSSYAEGLAEKRIHHINVSLNSLKKSVFDFVTKGRLEKVLSGIEAALENGIDVRLNVTLLKYNMSEIPSIIDYAGSRGMNVNIIDLMPIFYNNGGSPKIMVKYWRSIKGDMKLVEDLVTKKAVRITRRELHNRRVYIMPSGIRVTVIKGYMNPEGCAHCTRMRITPDGHIKTCLYRDPSYDLKPYLSKKDVEGVKRIIIKANSERAPFFTYENIDKIKREWGLMDGE
jgi:cyclic pyranopterin phosphate synthase